MLSAHGDDAWVRRAGETPLDPGFLPIGWKWRCKNSTGCAVCQLLGRHEGALAGFMDEDEGFLCRGDTGAVLTVSPRSLVGLLFPPPYGDLFSLFATSLHLKFSRNFLLKHSSDWWNCGSDSSFHSISYSFFFFFFEICGIHCSSYFTGLFLAVCIGAHW